VDISQHPGPDWLELRLVGRLDTTWAEHVSQTIESAVQGGAHQIVLNFEQVEYISSLGIRVLLTHFKRLSSVNGRLSVSDPSAECLTILKATGLADILVADRPSEGRAVDLDVTHLRSENASYAVYPQAAPTPLRCWAVGKPERLTTSGFAAEDCRSLTFDSGVFGIGLGAFGNGYDDCRDRFGEFLALAGCAITLPTDDPHGRPDFIIEQGELVPRVETLYALVGAGDFSTMIRFDANAESGALGLTELTETLFAQAGSNAIAFAVLAETAGLVGAQVLRSPGTGAVSFQLPDVRDSLTFSTERVGDRSLAMMLGFAARSPSPEAGRYLRPLGRDSDIAAHVHAAVFSYRPVQRGELAFQPTFTSLFESGTPERVLHLMADTRPFEGVGESEFVRGASWVGALPAITVEAGH
jgi:anti-anti-sigma factor